MKAVLIKRTAEGRDVMPHTGYAQLGGHIHMMTDALDFLLEGSVILNAQIGQNRVIGRLQPGVRDAPLNL